MRLHATGRCLLLILLVAGSAQGADWPRFRGADGSGCSEERGLPLRWSSTQNIVWKTEMPGPGASSPITWGDRIFLTCYSGYGLDQSDPGDQADLKRHLLCLNRADGKIVWDRTVEGAAEIPFGRFQARHGYASSTPATDGKQVYVFFGKEGVFAFDFDGKPVWQADVGTQTHNWGSATSPVLAGDLVIVNASVESRSLVALDQKTGREVWRAPGMNSSWNTPLLVAVGNGKQELIVSVKGFLLAFDPATGKQLWKCPGINGYVCPSVVAKDGIVYAIGGRRKTAVAVKTGGRGDVEPLWTQGVGSNVSSPVVYGDYLYWVSDRGIAHCVKTETGETVYQKRIAGGFQPYASALVADGKIYSVSRSRGTIVLAAKPVFKQLAQNDLSPDTSLFNASPVVSNGQLLLRSNKFLYCIGKK